jgi:hypothetical protein
VRRFESAVDTPGEALRYCLVVVSHGSSLHREAKLRHLAAHENTANRALAQVSRRFRQLRSSSKRLRFTVAGFLNPDRELAPANPSQLRFPG